MKTIRVLSQGEILDSSCKLKDNLVISFYNTTDYSIIEKQKVSFVSNSDILEYQDSILTLQKDDVQKLSKFQIIKHSIKPYPNIFDNKDCEKIIDFLYKKNYKNKNIIFQCEYGKSRSLTTAICFYNAYLNKTHELMAENNIIRNKVIEEIVLKHFKGKK